MKLLSILSKGLQAMFDEAMTPESFKAGEHFENYVRQNLFIESYYDLLEKTHDYRSNSRDYVQSSLKPDFKFRDRWSKKEFYVEAKFRSGLLNGKIEWCSYEQLKRYREYNKTTPVYIIIGFGDDPRHPEFISLLPIEAAKYTGLFPSYAEQFAIDTEKAVSSRILWNR